MPKKDEINKMLDSLIDDLLDVPHPEMPSGIEFLNAALDLKGCKRRVPIGTHWTRVVTFALIESLKLQKEVD